MTTETMSTTAAEISGYETGSKRIDVLEAIFAENDVRADYNREAFGCNGFRALTLMSSPGSVKTTVLGATLDELTSGWSSMTTRQPTCTIGTVAICTSLQTKLNRSKRNAPARIGIRYGDPMVGVHRYPCADRLFGGGDGPGVASRCPALSEDPADVADSWQLYGIPHCDSRDSNSTAPSTPHTSTARGIKVNEPNNIGLAPDYCAHMRLRPTVSGLPDQRRDRGHRNGRSDPPQYGSAKKFPWPHASHGNEHRDPENWDQPIHLQRHHRYQTGYKPQTVVTGPYPAHNQPRK
jgi:hypothetical protein